MNGQQGVQQQSGWQGMNQAPGYQPMPMNGVEQNILGSTNPTGQYQVDQSPSINQIQPGGSPNVGTLSSLAMLAMLA